MLPVAALNHSTHGGVRQSILVRSSCCDRAINFSVLATLASAPPHPLTARYKLKPTGGTLHLGIFFGDRFRLLVEAQAQHDREISPTLPQKWLDQG
jgi:hypothetical protein